MQRRQFLSTLALAGLAAGAAGAQQFGGPGVRVQQGERHPVQINSGGMSVLIEHVAVTGSGTPLVLDWAHGAALYYENRVNLSGSGIGGVFRTPFRVRWQQARPVGTVTLVAGAGLLIAEAEGVPPGAAVTLGAGDYAWDLPGRLSPGRGAPVAGANAGAVRMEQDGRLLIDLPQFHAQV